MNKSTEWDGNFYKEYAGWFKGYTYYTGRDGNSYYRYYDNTAEKVVCAAVAATGIAMSVKGMIMKSRSKRLIRQSVESYNSINGSAGIEWDFNFTGNGMGLVMRF